MMKVETVKVERVNIPKSFIQIELSYAEFWKLLARLKPHGHIYESYDNFYVISHNIVYFCKRGFES